MKILYITTIGGTMPFFTTLIHSLIERGDTVDIAANVSTSDVPACYREWGCKVYPLSCTRSPLDKGNLQAIQQIRKIVSEGDYDIVHCHTPIAAMCTRIACRPLRKKGVKVYYTAHGFHFFKGAPLKNWLIYYPVEWVCAHWTDVLVTINHEDYARAQKHMHAGRVAYVPGVGIDLEKFAPRCHSPEEKQAKRRALGLAEGDQMLLSVGELIERKAHASVIRALARLDDGRVHYVIAGSGPLHEQLAALAETLGVGEQVHLLGYRSDIAELCACADLFILPSLQEGLPVALMEAIASKTPVICSDIRGNTDLVGGEALFTPQDAAGIAAKIAQYLGADKTEEVARNYTALRQFDLSNVMEQMQALYAEEG